MLKQMVIVVAMSCFGFMATNTFAQNGFGFNAGGYQGQLAGGAGVGDNGTCQLGDGTGLGPGSMLAFGDGTEPRPQDGTGVGAPTNRYYLITQ